jgi:hypothetical protein
MVIVKEREFQLSLITALCVLFALSSGSSIQAQFSVGTWVQTAPMKGLTMTVEDCCAGGRRLIFRITLGKKTQTMMVESRFDGCDATVLIDGKPNGETFLRFADTLA